MKRGLTEFLGQGVRFYQNLAAAVYVGLRLNGAPASSFYINLMTSLPTSGTEVVTIDSAGNLGHSATAGGSGTVTSVDVALPTSVFSASSGAISSAGTISFTLNNQTGNVVFASPANGSAGVPTFRGLVANDIPTLTASKISDFDTQVRTTRLDQHAAPTASVNFNGQKAIGLLDGSNAQDAATWGQVQALFNGTDNKANVRVATTASLGLTSATATTITKTGGLPTTLDTIALNPNDRILVKNESGAGATGGAANGVYLYSAGNTWTRATDADINAEVTSGLFVFVSEGVGNGGNGYTLLTADPITLGTTQLNFGQTSGAGQIIAGAGLTKTGNQLDVVGTLNRILVNADSIDIDPAYVGQTSITTLGTIGTGTWQGNAVGVAYGGTGANNAASARTNLGAAGINRGTFTSVNITGGVLTINPGLGQQYGEVILIDNNDQKIGSPDNVTYTSATSWAIDMTFAGTITGTWKWVAFA
jgi:hypothetical protein